MSIALAAVAVAPSPARADFDSASVPPWEICALCHGLNGVSRTARFPKIAAQPQAYLEKQVRDFRHGARVNDGGQMVAIVSGEISEAQIPAVAAWFADQPAPEAGPPADGAATQTAGPLFTEGDAARGVPACISCHGKERIAETGAPRLEAQWAGYVEKQLTDFKSGARENDADGVMRAIASKLSDQEIMALGSYVHSLSRE